MPPLMVGFDLDMTLVDSRPGIAAAYRALTARTGVPVDADLAVSRLGPPLRTEIAHWFPPEQVEEAVTAYRELYPAYAITPTLPMPGAEAAIRAVHERGGRVMVVTSKIGRLAKLHLDHLGLAVDELAGDLFAEEKATALREHGATLYVGDHVADMAAAQAAGIPGVGVATGPCSRDELSAAGAHVVLDDLTGFPAALDRIIGLALEG
ncbi:HAD family hydrolase [Micromonospora sp. MA102]|uniref:HAD family hydrolase n=1 Tax=Micromonospora sp. MA102 TaxID=2952755 RepID=UPI0021CA762E|nr:HAD hydrolase-like protein [Micromonospora sp. MA102]